MLALLLSLLAIASGRAEYEFTTTRQYLAMKDGTKLSLTLFLPKGAPGEKFPALFEMQPYRKDDLFLMRDYELNSYFAKRGFAMVKADVRGTGSSYGAIPDREYSDLELADARTVIDFLAKEPWSNGAVGMWGISWSGFNAIQVAMDRPPAALKAILAVDASDDLFYDDVHFIDGVFHVDQYELSIENDLSLPCWPEYKFDREYFRDRFTREPWFFTYKRNQRDGKFWQDKSLRGKYDTLKIPSFLIGGLLDGYRDSIPRMVEKVPAPVKVIIGPWNHAWPDNAHPGPTVEWREGAVRWWNQWLRAQDTGILDEPEFIVFQRGGNPPDPDLKDVPGTWRALDWPHQMSVLFHLAPESRLTPAPPQGKLEVPVPARAAAGSAAGNWWGELTGDMAADDARSAIFDSAPLEKALELSGFPEVTFKFRFSSGEGPLSVRLEDVSPSGTSQLVTGMLWNPAHATGRDQPEKVSLSNPVTANLKLHFSTYTFQPGHRIRLAVSAAQFPMAWPGAIPLTTSISAPGSTLSIPQAKREGHALPDYFSSAISPRDAYPDGKYLSENWPRVKKEYTDKKGNFHVVWKGDTEFTIGRQKHRYHEHTHFRTNEKSPAYSYFEGNAGHEVIFPKRRIKVTTKITVASDAQHFHVAFTRRAFENEKLIKTKTWRESIKRDHQ